MESPVQKGDQHQLEVTGVSRSGRVRKKSSKLMDFQSIDDEPKVKKGKGRGRPPKNKNPKEFENNDKDDEDDENFVLAADEDEENSDSDMQIDDDDVLDDDIDEDVNAVDPTVRQSLYMQEKTNKKKFLKDGKVVFASKERKDKGKSRVTAYMLWSKNIRKQMLAKQPDLDFASSSRRIGEMWANVPLHEKVLWRRRAKRLSTKTKRNFLKEPVKANKTTANAPYSSSIFLNRSPIERTKKSLSVIATTPPRMSKSKEIPMSPPLLNSSNKISQPHAQPGVYKVTGIEPVDVAAHLRLLGESLTIIGERLKEHEGQITVSGSLSVLLDSLLCSLGPLMCLTTHIPGFNKKSLKDNLHKTLDNIAYVMPGL